MKRSTLFLQAAITLIAVAATAFLLIEPQFEGVNAHATFFQIYFQDPFLAYAYIASISFFTTLYQIFKLLGQLRNNESPIKALQTIKKCGFVMIAFVIGGEIWVLFSNSEDKPPGFFMGLLITFASLIIMASADVFEKILQKKS